jgi:hypothetical protein
MPREVGDCPDGLFETEARQQPPKHNLEDYLRKSIVWNLDWWWQSGCSVI